MRFNEDIQVNCNFLAVMRSGGKIVPGSRREAHNVFTTTGRNWLSKLVAWSTIGSTDIPFTNRRVRWIGVGSGTQLESTNVSSLVTPVLATSSDYLAVLDTVEFPTTTSARFIKEFGLSDINVTGAPVQISEMGLFVDANPALPGNANDGIDDVPHDAGTVDTILNPSLSVNPPIAYKAFEAMTKTVDFTMEVRWDLRFS